MKMANDEADPENDQLSEPKSKLPKQNVQQSCMARFYGQNIEISLN